jgi:hypothetical protein
MTERRNDMRRCRTLIVALLACAMLPASAHQVAASSELARRALIIGVSEYSHVLSLDHADSDARHFYRMLTNPDVGGGLRRGCSVSLHDGTRSRVRPSDA